MSLTSSTGHGFGSAHPLYTRGVGVERCKLARAVNLAMGTGDEHEMPSEIPGL